MQFYTPALNSLVCTTIQFPQSRLSLYPLLLQTLTDAGSCGICGGARTAHDLEVYY